MRPSLPALLLICMAATARADLFAIEGLTRTFMGRYSSTGQRLGTVTGSESLGSLRSGPDAHLYVLSNILGYGDIQRIDPTTGAVESLLLASVPDLSQTGLTIPAGIAFDNSGTLYVGSNTFIGPQPPLGVTGVMRYDATDRRLDRIIAFADGDVIAPLSFTADGTLLVAVNSVVRRYDPATGADLGVVNPRPVLGPAGPDGKLYARDAQGGISRYEPDGTLLGQFIAPGAGGLAGVTDLTFGNDGFLYVNSYNASAVLRYRADTGAFIDRFIEYSSVPGGVVWEIEAVAVPEPQALTPSACLVALGLTRRRRGRYTVRGVTPCHQHP